MSGKLCKILLISVPAVLFIVIAIAIIPSLLKNSNAMTGDEWLKYQQVYTEEMSEFAETMDSMVSEYVTGSMPEQDFLNYTEILRQEVLIMRKAYDQDHEQNPVKPGTDTEDAQYGCDSVYSCYGILLELLDNMKENSSEPEAVLYSYLAYSQELKESIAGYQAAYITRFGVEGYVTVEASAVQESE